MLLQVDLMVEGMLLAVHRHFGPWQINNVLVFRKSVYMYYGTVTMVIASTQVCDTRTT